MEGIICPYLRLRSYFFLLNVTNGWRIYFNHEFQTDTYSFFTSLLCEFHPWLSKVIKSVFFFHCQSFCGYGSCNWNRDLRKLRLWSCCFTCPPKWLQPWSRSFPLIYVKNKMLIGSPVLLQIFISFFFSDYFLTFIVIT